MKRSEKVVITVVAVAVVICSGVAVDLHHRHVVQQNDISRLSQQEIEAAQQSQINAAEAKGQAEQKAADQVTITKLQSEVKPTTTTKTSTVK